MALNLLLTVLSPPDKPVEVPSTEAWKTIEKELCPLPADYKAFVNQFGTGTIDRFIWILNPASKNPYLNFSQIKPILDGLRELKKSGEACPYPLFPEEGGLLPFGKSDNGDVLYWLTIGEPERWLIVVNAARDASYEKFPCDMTSFLEGILTRRYRCSVFPQTFPSGPTTFVSEDF
jgi:hypothetical protein